MGEGSSFIRPQDFTPCHLQPLINGNGRKKEHAFYSLRKNGRQIEICTKCGMLTLMAPINQKRMLPISLKCTASVWINMTSII